ncbi:MAG: RHS repeat-associated core domain-containing protein [Cyanobacteria bacterium P01_F01_bin.56]
MALENKTGDTVISSYRYELNAAGHRLSVTEDDGRQVSYTYDDLYRLTEENINNGERVISYTFDKVGNRLTRNDSVEGITTYTYDDNDRLQTEILSQNGTVIDTTTYTYDDNGNLIQQVKNGTEATTYTWNDDNRLVAVTTPEGNSVTYEYDDSGIRVSTTVDGETTEYLIDKNRAYAQVLEEFIDDELAVSYVYGHDLISQTRAEDTSYYQVDGLGSTRVLTDELGNVTDTYDYDAFGNLIDSSGGTKNSYQFAGEQYDENLDNYYLRQRYYDQQLGVLISQDFFEGLTEVPRSLHKYAYVFNDPVNTTDPTGLFPAWLEGVFVHNFIGLHFVAQNASDHLSNRWIQTILEERRSSAKASYSEFNKRPDLIDISDQELYEIKTVREAAKGVAQLQGYVNILNKYDPGWTMGTSYRPPSTATVPTVGLIRIYEPTIVGSGYEGIVSYEKHQNNNKFNLALANSLIMAAQITAIAALINRTQTTAALTRGFI